MQRTPTTPALIHNILALDVGDARIGLAIASSLARLPRPLTFIKNDTGTWPELSNIIQNESVGIIVVGLPRSLIGQETAQTKIARKFARDAQKKLKLPIFLQDEALTSYHAEAELLKTGKKFDKGAIDALAATIILEDFLRDHPGEING